MKKESLSKEISKINKDRLGKDRRKKDACKEICKEKSKDLRIIDISKKEVVSRTSIAEGKIVLKKRTIELIKNRKIKKGDVFAVAQIAAIQAVKRTSEIIPLCHNIPIECVEIDFEVNDNDNSVKVRCKVKSTYKTGVEMEALTGVCAALLTIWDMTKYIEKDRYGKYPDTRIEHIRVIDKIKTK